MRVVLATAAFFTATTAYVPPRAIASCSVRSIVFTTRGFRSSVLLQAPDDDISKLTVKQLKERLRATGLPVSGLKAELVSRLSSGGTSAAPPPPAELTDSAIVNDANPQLAGGLAGLVEIEHCKQ